MESDRPTSSREKTQQREFNLTSFTRASWSMVLLKQSLIRIHRKAVTVSLVNLIDLEDTDLNASSLGNKSGNLDLDLKPWFILRDGTPSRPTGRGRAGASRVGVGSLAGSCGGRPGRRRAGVRISGDGPGFWLAHGGILSGVNHYLPSHPLTGNLTGPSAGFHVSGQEDDAKGSQKETLAIFGPEASPCQNLSLAGTLDPNANRSRAAMRWQHE